jgi:hypothetical protein
VPTAESHKLEGLCSYGEALRSAGSVSDEQPKEIFGDSEAPRPYIRIVLQPRQRATAEAKRRSGYEPNCPLVRTCQ